MELSAARYERPTIDIAIRGPTKFRNDGRGVGGGALGRMLLSSLKQKWDQGLAPREQSSITPDRTVVVGLRESQA